MFYAAEHRYDIRFCNDYIALYRFANKAERDTFVSDRNFIESGDGNMKTEEVTRDEARRKFPEAFRIVGDCHDVCDERDWLKSDDGYEFWSHDNLYEW